MVTKKQRRRQLARASAERRAQRRTAREQHRRRVRTLTAAVLVLVALAGLVLWIATHGDAGNTAKALSDYDAVSVHHIPTAIAEVTR